MSETATAYNISTPADVTEAALELLQSVLLPGELMRLAKRLREARESRGFVSVAVEFERGHPRRIVYSDSELLTRE